MTPISTATRRLHVIILHWPSGPQAHGVSSTQDRVKSFLLKSWPIEHWDHMSKVTYVWHDETPSGTGHPTCISSKKLKTKSLPTCEEMSLSHKPSKQRWHTKKLVSSCKVIRVTTPVESSRDPSLTICPDTLARDSAYGWASRDTYQGIVRGFKHQNHYQDMAYQKATRWNLPSFLSNQG